MQFCRGPYDDAILGIVLGDWIKTRSSQKVRPIFGS